MTRSIRALLLLIAVALPVTAAEPPYRVIVHPRNEVSAVDRQFLSEAFLKKTTRWDSGEVIRPVDLGPDTPARRRFSMDVLGRSVSAVKSYWQQNIFSGRGVPPPELANDGDVVRYVLTHEGALGYVSASTDVGTAKIVPVK